METIQYSFLTANTLENLAAAINALNPNTQRVVSSNAGYDNVNGFFVMVTTIITEPEQ